MSEFDRLKGEKDALRKEYDASVDEKVALRAECDRIAGEKRVLEERIAELGKQVKATNRK